DTGDRWAQVNLAAMAAGTVSKVYPNAPPGIFFSAQNGIPSDPGMPKNALNTNWTGFAPRLGFAYDVFGNGKTSLRGGAGGFYESRTNGFANNRFSGTIPWSPQTTLTTPQGPFSNPYLGVTDPFRTATGKPSPNTVFAAPLLVYTWAPGNKLVPPRAYEWNLTIEQQ